jgi:hypothetical protein
VPVSVTVSRTRTGDPRIVEPAGYCGDAAPGEPLREDLSYVPGDGRVRLKAMQLPAQVPALVAGLHAHCRGDPEACPLHLTPRLRAEQDHQRLVDRACGVQSALGLGQPQLQPMRLQDRYQCA